MATCPKCNEEINHLIQTEIIRHDYNVVLMPDGRLDYEDEQEPEDLTGRIDAAFKCPECGNIVFNKDEKTEVIKKFLKVV